MSYIFSWNELYSRYQNFGNSPHLADAGLRRKRHDLVPFWSITFHFFLWGPRYRHISRFSIWRNSEKGAAKCSFFPQFRCNYGLQTFSEQRFLSFSEQPDACIRDCAIIEWNKYFWKAPHKAWFSELILNSELNHHSKMIFRTNLTTQSSLFEVLLSPDENQLNDLPLPPPNLNCKISFCSKCFGLSA